MALVNCPECNKEISDAALKCPHCGYPLREEETVVIQNNSAPGVISLILGILACLSLFLFREIVTIVLGALTIIAAMVATITNSRPIGVTISGFVLGVLSLAPFAVAKLTLMGLL